MRFSAVLLAGGKSTRMGRDKALLDFAGQPLWQRQLETLRRLSPERLMVSGPPRDGCDTIADEIENAGPLAGVAAALRKCASLHLVVLAVDLPLVTTDFLRSLLARCSDEKGVVPLGPEFFEPLAAVYPSACAVPAAAALRRGDFSMQHFVQAAITANLLAPRKLSSAEAELFANLNTPADL